jgi:hypothetical protein
MVSIYFCPPAPLLTSGTILDCKMFQQSMFGFPSDRHAYHLKCCMLPMRYCFFLLLFYKIIVSSGLMYFMFSQGRLPYQVKNFVKYIRLATPPPLYYIHVTKTVPFFSRDINSTLLTAEPGPIGFYHHNKTKAIKTFFWLSLKS